MQYKRDIWDLLMKVPESLSSMEQEELHRYYHSTERERLLHSVKERKIVPFAAEVLYSLNINTEFWHEIYLEYEDRNSRIITMLDEVFEFLKKKGCISPCVTENFGALLTVDRHIGSFCSGDVDISADDSEKSVIREIMAENGFQLVTRKNYHARINSDEFICPEKYLSGFYLNFVWCPVIREKAYTIDQRQVEKWLKTERLNGTTYRDTRIQLLTPEAMLIHCIYHLSAGHYYLGSPGTKLITEIDRIIRYKTLDWDLIWDNARAIGVERRIRTALILSEKILDTPLEMHDFDSTVSSSVRRLVSSLYRDEDGLMTVVEPTGLMKRLKVDIVSDDHNAIIAAIYKIMYAIYWCIFERNHE